MKDQQKMSKKERAAMYSSSSSFKKSLFKKNESSSSDSDGDTNIVDELRSSMLRLKWFNKNSISNTSTSSESDSEGSSNSSSEEDDHYDKQNYSSRAKKLSQKKVNKQRTKGKMSDLAEKKSQTDLKKAPSSPRGKHANAKRGGLSAPPSRRLVDMDDHERYDEDDDCPTGPLRKSDKQHDKKHQMDCEKEENLVPSNNQFLLHLQHDPTVPMTFVFLLQEGDSHDFFKIHHKLQKVFQ